MQDSLHNCRANCDKHIKGLETKVHQMKKAKSGESDEINKLICQLFGYEIHKSLLFILFNSCYLMAEGLTYVKCMQRIKSTPAPLSPILLITVSRRLHHLLRSMTKPTSRLVSHWMSGSLCWKQCFSTFPCLPDKVLLPHTFERKHKEIRKTCLYA